MITTKYWGEHGEYGPYRVGANGLPNFSDVVRDFLEKNELSAEEFGELYGKVARKNQQSYTKSRIYQMIRDNAFPTDPKRRWVLAKLLHIPPFLLGVASLDDLLTGVEINKTPEETHIPTKAARSFPEQKHLDLREYRQALRKYWQQNRTSTAWNIVGEIRARVGLLEKAILYGETSHKQRWISLLCGYHMVLANIASDQEGYDEAIIYLNKAYILAKETTLYALQAAILCRRGWVFKERGEQAARLHHFDPTNQDFAFAADDFNLARALETHLSPGVRGSILISLGKVRADMAQTPQALGEAMKLIGEAELFVGQATDEDDLIHFVMLDEERYYLDRAAAYLAPPVKLVRYPRDARRELRNAAVAQATPNPKRRQAYNTILQAQSYFVEGEYAEATRKAREALVTARSIHSTINLARIAALCEDLKASEYGKSSIDVAMLEVELMRVKHPEIFFN